MWLMSGLILEKSFKLPGMSCFGAPLPGGFMGRPEGVLMAKHTYIITILHRESFYVPNAKFF